MLRDVWRAHVLFTEDEVTGLIDLTAVASDHVTVDLTRLVRSWFGADVTQVRNAVEQFQQFRKTRPTRIATCSGSGRRNCPAESGHVVTKTTGSRGVTGMSRRIYRTTNGTARGRRKFLPGVGTSSALSMLDFGSAAVRSHAVQR